jgi:hypothetical protein
MMTTSLLFDGTLGDMVAVSTTRTGIDAAGEEGGWRMVTRAESHHHDDLNLWRLVDADCINKATVTVEDELEVEVEVSRRLLVTPPPHPLLVVVGSDRRRRSASPPTTRRRHHRPRRR